MRLAKMITVALLALSLAGAGASWAREARDAEDELRNGVLTKVDEAESVVTIDKKQYMVVDQTVMTGLDGEKLSISDLLPKTTKAPGVRAGRHVVFQSASIPEGEVILQLEVTKPQF